MTFQLQTLNTLFGNFQNAGVIWSSFIKYLSYYKKASRKRFARMHVFSWIIWFYKGEALFHIGYVYGRIGHFDCFCIRASAQDLNTNLVCNSE